MNKIISSEKGERFEVGLLVVVAAISISLFSFVTEGNNITGLAIAENEEVQISQQILLEFKNIESLSTLSAGSYFIDGNGIVYFIDDETEFAIAKFNFVDEVQKNKGIYIDAEGRIGYILESIENEEYKQKS